MTRNTYKYLFIGVFEVIAVILSVSYVMAGSNPPYLMTLDEYEALPVHSYKECSAIRPFTPINPHRYSRLITNRCGIFPQKCGNDIATFTVALCGEGDPFIVSEDIQCNPAFTNITVYSGPKVTIPKTCKPEIITPKPVLSNVLLSLDKASIPSGGSVLATVTITKGTNQEQVLASVKSGHLTFISNTKIAGVNSIVSVPLGKVLFTKNANAGYVGNNSVTLYNYQDVNSSANPIAKSSGFDIAKANPNLVYAAGNNSSRTNKDDILQSYVKKYHGQANDAAPNQNKEDVIATGPKVTVSAPTESECMPLFEDKPRPIKQPSFIIAVAPYYDDKDFSKNFINYAQDAVKDFSKYIPFDKYKDYFYFFYVKNNNSKNGFCPAPNWDNKNQVQAYEDCLNEVRDSLITKTKSCGVAKDMTYFIVFDNRKEFPYPGASAMEGLFVKFHPRVLKGNWENPGETLAHELAHVIGVNDEYLSEGHDLVTQEGANCAVTLEEANKNQLWLSLVNQGKGYLKVGFFDSYCTKPGYVRPTKYSMMNRYEEKSSQGWSSGIIGAGPSMTQKMVGDNPEDFGPFNIAYMCKRLTEIVGVNLCLK